MDALQQAQGWVQSGYFDQETREAARASIQNPEALLSAFGSELTFGTGGLRGVLGVGTARMNRYTVARATLGLARWLRRRAAQPSVAIAHDSRHGSEEFTRVAAETLAAEGVHVHVFPELAPTPMLSYAVRSLRCDAGIMITASHNPKEYNGYKVYGPDGCQITDRAAGEITGEIDKCAYTDPRALAGEEARKNGLWSDVGDEVRKSFAQACLFCRADPSVCTAVRAAYTPLHGAGLQPVREVLGHMQGVTVVEVEAQVKPDGDFPTCAKPNPELPDALALGLRTAERCAADLLLATDPDCDRVGVAVRTPQGAYQILSGNEVGLLLLQYILRTRKEQGSLPESPVVVKTIVSSDLAFPIAKAFGAEVREVLTGFKYIGETIGELERAGGENRFVFGFEESCGYLAGTHVRDKDGVMACMLVCEMAQALKSEGLTLWEALRRLYEEYGYLASALTSFDIEGALPMKAMESAMASLRKNPPQALAGRAVEQVRDYAGGLNGLPPSNVLSFEGGGLKAVVRPSGTEPKVKVYLFARGRVHEEAERMLEAMKADAELWLKR